MTMQPDIPQPHVDNEPQEVVRGRPGRRSAEERKQAVLDLFAGKASVDQLARRYGVLPSTVEGWRDEALAAMDSAFKTGGKRKEDAAIARENRDLKAAVTELSIQNALLKQAQALRPYPPARSPR
jgi:transposase-like protein